MMDEEFVAEMKRRGWDDEFIQALIKDYHAMVENLECLKENPNLKELVPIEHFISDTLEEFLMITLYNGDCRGGFISGNMQKGV